MNKFEEYIVKLLRGHLTYGGRTVEIRRQFLPVAELPCVTLDLSSGTSTNYSYHDFSDGVDTLYFNRSARININLWCNTEAERESLSEQIMECFYLEKTNHYRYCANYNDGLCRSGGVCRVSTTNTIRSVKNKCPDPDAYNYKTLSEDCCIVDDTIRLEAPFMMDELDRDPPLLRNVFEATCDYEEPVLSHGVRLEDAYLDDVDIE